MVASTQVDFHPMRDGADTGAAAYNSPSFPHSSDPDAGMRLAEFVLRVEQGSATPRQAALRHENPFCRLAACTQAGAQVCNRGCGIANAASDAAHACPFGMLMRRVGPAESAGEHRWIGRRFTGVAAMHAALDRLAEAGIDEELILQHLPPNPIIDSHELEAALQEAATSTTRPSVEPPSEQVIAAPAQTANPEYDTRLGNLLEYLAQIHSLIGGATRAEIICERFLRAMSGALPFSEMDIYLPEPTSGELIISASIDHQPAGVPRPQAQQCRLQPGDLGLEAFNRRLPLLLRGGNLVTLTGPADAPDAAAFPLLMPGGQALGVWVARHRRGESKSVGIVGREWSRFMTLLAHLLASTLDRTRQHSPAAETTSGAAATDPPGKATPSPANQDAASAALEEEFRAVLDRETARAARLQQPLALLRLQLSVPRRQPRFAQDDLTTALRSSLRPYDHLLAEAVYKTRAAKTCAWGWTVVLPGANEQAARGAALRLLTVCEDVMDAHGGMEELGLAAGCGISLFGSDASRAVELEQHAAAAATQALALGGDAVIQCFQDKPTAASA